MPLRIVRTLALCLSLAAGAAAAAPVTLPLTYANLDGDPGVQISGSVTFDDAVWTPFQNIFDESTGLIAVNIVVTGPDPVVPGGTQTFTIVESPRWIFATDGLNNIIDVNFRTDDSADGCFLYGLDRRIMGFYCGAPEDEEDYIAVFQLGLRQASIPVPTSNPATLALLALLLAAAAGTALYRRR